MTNCFGRIFFERIADKNKITFYSMVWGNHLNYFFSYTASSLLQEGNIPSLARQGYELHYFIYTNPWEYEEISKQYEPCCTLLNKYMTLEIIPLPFREDRTPGYYWRSGLAQQIPRCIEENAMFFLAPPDTIFGNGTVGNALKLVQGKNVCLSAPHPRVSQENILTSKELDGLKRLERIIENDELVDLAFEYGHPVLRDAFDNKDSNRTLGGISIRRINDSSYSVIANEPTVYLANFVADDLKFFSNVGSPWDGRWMRLLFRQNRLKVVGSSDLFFCVELTSNERNLHPMGDGLLNNDKYLTKGQRYAHNYVFNSFCSVWRGKGKTETDTLVEKIK